jgi:pyruvate/2-oxoglutarate dehydrogenase complex dihydrolipoamide dehydrogenase (E3) component
MSAFKVLIDETSHRILGAHLLATAPMKRSTCSPAIRSNMRAPDLREVIFAYTTHASDVQHML